MRLPLILASASPARLKLLQQIGLEPDQILPSDIDETERLGETPRKMAHRLSHGKAMAIANQVKSGIIIGSDTIPVVGRRIMRKTVNAEDVRESLQLLSQRRHQIYTGVCVIQKNGEQIRTLHKVVKSIIKFKKLSKEEIDYYCASGEGIGKAGGYNLTGHAESFVSFISGSFSNIIGLPLFETLNMLNSVGVTPHSRNK